MNAWRLATTASSRNRARLLAGFLAVGLALSGAWAAADTLEPPSHPQIERGRPVWVLDTLGNILSIPQKIILWNWRVDRHRVSPKTEQALQGFLDEHRAEVGDVKVRVNQWTPAGEFKRLIHNHRIEWYFRVFPGIPTTLWSSVTGRLLGGDHYNPYTNTIHLFSDDPAVALHEAGHAVDFAKNPSPGLYAVGRLLPPVTLEQEHVASDIAIQHYREHKDREGELHAYRTLYPAFGTYVGGEAGIPYGTFVGAAAGHVLGIRQRYESRLGYQALDHAQPGPPLIHDELSRSLQHDQEASRTTLGNALSKPTRKLSPR